VKFKILLTKRQMDPANPTTMIG